MGTDRFDPHVDPTERVAKLDRTERVRAARSHPAGQHVAPVRTIVRPPTHSPRLTNTVLALALVFLLLGITIEVMILAAMADLL